MNKATDNPNPLRLLVRKEVEQILRISRSTIYARLDPDSPRFDPDFPKPIRHSNSCRSKVWIEAEVFAYISRRISDSRKPTDQT